MKTPEIRDISISILIFTFVGSLYFIVKSEFNQILPTFIFSILIILLAVFSKKITAYLLDSNVEHELWNIDYLNFNKSKKLTTPLPGGIIFPLIISLITLGAVKFTAFLTYETRALKYRASKRFGFYSYTAMTDIHNGIIGASSTVCLLILAGIAYFLPNANLEYLAKLSIYYAFWNLIPVSKLDGTQIFFGSKILWSVLMAITTIACILSIITI